MSQQISCERNNLVVVCCLGIRLSVGVTRRCVARVRYVVGVIGLLHVNHYTLMNNSDNSSSSDVLKLTAGVI